MAVELPSSLVNLFLGLHWDYPVVGGPLRNLEIRSGPHSASAGIVSTVGDYLDQGWPPYGVIVVSQEGRKTLVWIDATNNRHVIDVEGEPIADEVSKPPYVSPDPGFIEDLLTRVQQLADSGAQLGTTLIQVAMFGLLLWLFVGLSRKS